jgi:hypothetical protein
MARSNWRGPEASALDECVRRVLGANDDARRVVADIHARYFGAQLDDRSLTPGDSPRLAPTRFEDWLALHQPERSFS